MKSACVLRWGQQGWLSFRYSLRAELREYPEMSEERKRVRYVSNPQRMHFHGKLELLARWARPPAKQIWRRNPRLCFWTVKVWHGSYTLSQEVKKKLDRDLEVQGKVGHK